MNVLLLQGTALHLPLLDQSVSMVCTSPPYWNLRDYGVSGQLGLERTLETYLAALVAVFREVWRVLHPTGTCWINIGDSYNAAGRQGHGTRIGYKQGTNRASATGCDWPRSTEGTLKEKDLCMVPARLALALQADGWYLRSEIVWAKKNCMPESVTDRPTRSHEMVYLFSKQARYFYDGEAVKEASIDAESYRGMGPRQPETITAFDQGYDGHRTRVGLKFRTGACYPTRSLRSVWSLATEPTPFAHFATMPRELVRRCILAGTSAHGCCAVCGAPWQRVVARQRLLDGQAFTPEAFCPPTEPFRMPANGVGHDRYRTVTTNQGWYPSCTCYYGPGYAAPMPATVLDPFCGSGTTLLVARELGRHGVGLDLSWPYLHAIARQRLGLTALATWEGRTGQPAPQSYAHLPLFAGGT